MNARIILTLLFLGISYSSTAQTSFNFGAQQAKIWELAKQRTIAVAQAMPESNYNYKPTPEVKSFGQQFAHIANSMLSMETRFINKQSYRAQEKNASNMSKAEIIADLTSAFDTVIAQLKTISDQALQPEGKPHGAFPLSKWESYLFMYDHITNHRAKAVLYLRLNSIAPPVYGYN